MDRDAKTRQWVKVLDGYFKTLAKGFAVERGAPNKHWRAPTLDGRETPVVAAITIGWDHSFGCFLYAEDPGGQYIDYHSRAKLPAPQHEIKLADDDDLRAVVDACAALPSLRSLPRAAAGVRLRSHQEQGAGPSLEAVIHEVPERT